MKEGSLKIGGLGFRIRIQYGNDMVPVPFLVNIIVLLLRRSGLSKAFPLPLNVLNTTRLLSLLYNRIKPKRLVACLCAMISYKGS